MVIIMENVIRIYLKERKDYKNTYNENILSYELSNYILEELNGIAEKQNISFSVSSEFDMSEQEKEDFVYMIRKFFGADISEKMNLRIKQRTANYLIFLIGIVFILIYSFWKITFVSEFVLIFGWVFIGEAICNFLYKGVENKHQIMRRKQIVEAKIIFE